MAKRPHPEAVLILTTDVMITELPEEELMANSLWLGVHDNGLSELPR